MKYSGQTNIICLVCNARIVAYGLFGGFIFGFLGTAMRRMLSAPPLGTRNVLALFCLHLASVLAFAAEKIFWGDSLFLALLWPRIMASHYIYGAVIWTAGVLLWSSYVLPKIAQVEVE